MEGKAALYKIKLIAVQSPSSLQLPKFEPSCCHLPASLRSHLHREGFPQSKEQGVHVDIGILPEAVGLGVVLEVEVIPPTGRGSLWEGRGRKCLKEGGSSALGSLLILGLVLAAEQGSGSPSPHPVPTLRWPMTNLCTQWFHLDLLKTDRCPKSCWSQPAWAWN